MFSFQSIITKIISLFFFWQSFNPLKFFTNSATCKDLMPIAKIKINNVKYKLLLDSNLSDPIFRSIIFTDKSHIRNLSLHGKNLISIINFSQSETKIFLRVDNEIFDTITLLPHDDHTFIIPLCIELLPTLNIVLQSQEINLKFIFQLNSDNKKFFINSANNIYNYKNKTILCNH